MTLAGRDPATLFRNVDATAHHGLTIAYARTNRNHLVRIPDTPDCRCRCSFGCLPCTRTRRAFAATRACAP